MLSQEGSKELLGSSISGKAKTYILLHGALQRPSWKRSCRILPVPCRNSPIFPEDVVWRWDTKRPLPKEKDAGIILTWPQTGMSEIWVETRMDKWWSIIANSLGKAPSRLVTPVSFLMAVPTPLINPSVSLPLKRWEEGCREQELSYGQWEPIKWEYV